MSDYAQGPDWWQASDGMWYPPEQAAPAAPTGPWAATPPPAAPYATPYGTPAYQTQTTNGMAIAAMVCGIIGLATGWLTCGVTSLAAIPAVICGHMARKQINETGGTQPGAGMAMAGLVLGYIGIGLIALGIIAIIVLAATGEDFDNTNDFGMQLALLSGRG